MGRLSKLGPGPGHQVRAPDVPSVFVRAVSLSKQAKRLVELCGSRNSLLTLLDTGSHYGVCFNGRLSRFYVLIFLSVYFSLSVCYTEKICLNFSFFLITKYIFSLLFYEKYWRKKMFVNFFPKT